MGCGSCGVTNADGKIGGCGSSGGCSSGGCNKMNSFNWLSDIPLSDFGKPFSIVEVSFNEGSRKEFYINKRQLDLYSGALVTVEGVNGVDVGTVNLYGELVKLQMKRYNVAEGDVSKKILRFSAANEIELLEEKKLKEHEILVAARAISRAHNLDMKIGYVALQADGKKLIIYYTANSRVDFREVLKVFASTFNARIEMKQIGARQESGIVGGIGSCGRELCCSTWLTDFKAVGTPAARYQNLSINQTKLSGQCGKLKCCLNYELDSYMEMVRSLPERCDEIILKDGKYRLVKKDLLKGLLFYSFEDKSRQYPLKIERVKEILVENKKGIFPAELGVEESEINTQKNTGISVDSGFVNDVGQLTYESLARTNRKSKKKKKPLPTDKKNTAQQDRNNIRSESQTQPSRQKRNKPPQSQRNNNSVSNDNIKETKQTNTNSIESNKGRKPQNRNNQNRNTRDNKPKNDSVE